MASAFPSLHLVRPARSRYTPRHGVTSNKSASGLEVKRCAECSQSARLTKETVHNGLQLLRLKYGLPYCELPDCSPDHLSRFLSFLLQQGKERPSVAFPRRQVWGTPKVGLCRLQRLGRRARWELAHSCASIKRNLPSGCSRHTPSVRSQWEKNALSQPPPPSDEYLAHVRRCATRIFTPGWDRDYGSFVGNHLPNPTSRKPRLSRADLLWAGRRGEFFTATTSETDLPPVFEARYKEVLSAGKRRPLLIYDEKVDLLAPLHKMFYSHLRRQNWLLCGPPTEERMASVCVREYQTSVDLVAATDGLHHSVAEALLDVAFFTSVKVPRSIRSLAKGSLSPVFQDARGVHRRVRHGQMMGAYLSFPLLCLQSYCAASWAARFDPEARFLVNGDDSVISASRGITVCDYPSGYRLNGDKTIVSRSVVEVNSTCFLLERRGWRVVRHLRRGGAPSSYRGILHMASAVVSAGVAWMDALVRARIGSRWGFLPSQLGLITYGYGSYAAFLRQRQMLRRRYHTDLPSCSSEQDEASLRRIYGRDATPVEREALRSFLWVHGRRGGLKRDESDPSHGRIRRTYGYRDQPCKSWCSFVGYTAPKSFLLRRKRTGFFLLPEEFETEEEMRGLSALDLWVLP